MDSRLYGARYGGLLAFVAIVFVLSALSELVR
jgi:hypothetical protein